MIESKKDLKRYLDLEKKKYNKKRVYIFRPCFSESSLIWKYVCRLRYEEYHYNSKHKFRYLFYHYLKTKLGRQLGFSIPINVIDEGLKLMHIGSVLVNATKVGKNCSLHINTALVANGHNASNPTLGDNIVVGIGSTIVGGVYIADGIAIGANSLVNKSFYEKNIAIAGNPAKKISNNGSNTWNKKEN